MKDKAGTINASAMTNVLLGAVNEALIGDKKGNNSKAKTKMEMQIKGKPDMSEVEAAKKEAAKPVETPVKLKLDASELKALQNLPTAKMKVDFLVNKGAISKSIGKDLQAAIGKAYSDVSRKFKDFPGSKEKPGISLDNFMKRVPELSAHQRSGIIQTLTDKGIISDKNIPESYETVYRLKSYLENAKKAVSKTIPSEAFIAPDLSLSAAEYGNAINEQVKLVQNVLNASKFFADLSSKMNVKAAAKVSPEEMYKLMGVGSGKADTGNYVAYLADQITKKANVYDIIDQVVAGALDPTQISQKDIENSISKITKKKESTPKVSSTGKTKKKVKPVIDDSDDSDRPEGNIEKLYDELKDAYKNFVEARKARKTNSIHPSDYALKSAVFREAYAKVAPHLFEDEKEKFVGPKPMSQEVAQLAADSTRKTVEQIYSIKKPLKDLGYLGNNPDVSKIFDRISNRIIKINADKLNNRDNENGDTDEIIKNIGVMNKLASQLEDMIHADGHVGFAIKNLPTITKPATTASSLPNNSDTKKQAEKAADTIVKTADQVVDAKSKEADAIVAANDKITESEKKVASVTAPVQSDPTEELNPIEEIEKERELERKKKAMRQITDEKNREVESIVNNNNRITESEKKVTDQIADSAKIQKDATKIISVLKNNNSDLTEEPVTPPELDGLKQLSQKEFGDAQKYIKVYEDTNRTIYTLTQTYKKQFDSNGNLLAEGYENAIAYYDSYEKLEKEAVALSKRINSNYAKLDTERYKSTDKQNPNLIKKLQDDIKSDQQDLSELHRIARLHSSLPDNDYVYQNFTQALRKGSAESSRSLASTRKTNRDNFNVQKNTLNTDLSKQISNVESLGQAGAIAATKLQSVQQALSSITTPAGLEDAKKQIEDIGKQFDANKTRESALNYVHNLEQGLTGKQNVVIGKKNASDDFTGSIKNGEWTGLLAGLNSRFETNYQSTSADLKRYIADAQMLGDVGKEAASSFSTLQKNLEACYTESGLEQIQNGMKVTQKQLAAAKKQADEAAKNSETAKINDQYTQIMSDMSNLEKKNKELRTALKNDKNADYIKNITAERDAYKQAVAGADEYIDKHKEVLGDKAVKQYNTAKSRVGQAETDIENDIAAQTKAIDTKDFTDRYTSAIADVKALGEAYKELSSIQKEAFSKKSGQSATTLDDYNQRITAAQNKIKTLTTKVQDFRDNVWGSDAAQADKLNQKVFDNYEKQFDNMSNTKDNYTADLVEAMKTAYQLKRSTEASLLKKAMNISLDSGQSAELKGKSSYASQLYGSLRDQVIDQFGKDFQEQAISDLRTTANSQRSDILNTNFKTLSDDIGQYVSSVTKAGRASKQFESDFSGISTDLVNLQNTFSSPSKLNSQGIAEYFDQMNAIAKNYESLKQHYSSGVGKISLDYEQALGAISGEKSVGKNSNYLRAAQSYIEEYNGIWSKYNEDVKQFAEGSAERQQLTAQAEKDSTETIKKMQNLAKNASKYDQVTNQGTEIDWTANRTKNTKDASAFLSQYASSIGLTSEISTKINESTGQVTKTFTDISGNTVTLTGNIDKFNDSLRVTQSLISKNGSGMSSFGNSIKGLVSGNFKGAIADIANYVSYFQVTMKAIQQAKQGFNDFLNYDSDLTNISYTMDLSKNQLQNLGSSAIDMAKDLSMSLDNTMDIYKIYANMNTTASEIQETAKPTAILSNLSGVDASTAADQVQGILQQFHMLEDGSTSAADASMHIVDVLDKVSGSVGIDYAKGIKIISDAVQASGQVAYDAGMSYEQLAAITAKVSERTREDGSSIGNALKTNYCLYVQKCA